MLHNISSTVNHFQKKCLRSVFFFRAIIGYKTNNQNQMVICLKKVFFGTIFQFKIHYIFLSYAPFIKFI